MSSGPKTSKKLGVKGPTNLVMMLVLSHNIFQGFDVVLQNGPFIPLRWIHGNEGNKRRISEFQSPSGIPPFMNQVAGHQKNSGFEGKILEPCECTSHPRDSCVDSGFGNSCDPVLQKDMLSNI